ncbi:MAG: prepilin peptidase [Nitrosopumilaceae archaeon]
MEFLLDINGIRILTALGMLTIASVIDLWKREIHDSLWIAFGVVAVVLLFFEPNIPLILSTIGFSMIIVPLAIVIWRIGFFGGADAFCLIVLAGLVPMTTLASNVITPFTTLTNAAILSITPLFTNAVRNLIDLSNHKDIFYGFEETKFRKICAIFLGYKSANPKYGFSIEKTENGHKKINFSFHHAENADFCNTKDTWVTPGIPYVLYISVGFLIQLFVGDLFLNTFADFFKM